MATTLQAQLADFVNGGGTLVAMADLPTADELARPGAVFQQKLAAAGKTREWKTADQAWATERYHAAGRVLRLTAGVGTGIPAADLVAMLKKCAGRDAWADGDVLEVILRHAEDGNDYLFVQNPDLDQTRAATLKFTVPCAQLIDASLPGGVAVPMRVEGVVKSAPIRLGPAETAVLWLKR